MPYQKARYRADIQAKKYDQHAEAACSIRHVVPGRPAREVGNKNVVRVGSPPPGSCEVSFQFGANVTWGKNHVEGSRNEVFRDIAKVNIFSTFCAPKKA